jgi:hypothetical protein
MPEERIQKMTDRGRAMIYLTRPVKFKRRKRLPVKPQARDRAFRTISLSWGVHV